MPVKRTTDMVPQILGRAGGARGACLRHVSRHRSALTTEMGCQVEAAVGHFLADS